MSPGAYLIRAAAVAWCMAHKRLALVDAPAGAGGLDNYHLVHSARAEVPVGAASGAPAA